MKVLWNLEKTIAIPVSSILSFEISDTSGWSGAAKVLWNYDRFAIRANFANYHEYVFSSTSKNDCINFIESI